MIRVRSMVLIRIVNSFIITKGATVPIEVIVRSVESLTTADAGIQQC